MRECDGSTGDPKPCCAQVIVITPDSIDDMDWTNPRQAKDGYTHDWWHIEVRRLLPLFRGLDDASTCFGRAVCIVAACCCWWVAGRRC